MAVAIREARIRVIYNNDAPRHPHIRILIGDGDIYDGPPLSDDWIKSLSKTVFQAIKALESRASDAAWNAEHSSGRPYRTVVEKP